MPFVVRETRGICEAAALRRHERYLTSLRLTEAYCEEFESQHVKVKTAVIKCPGIIRIKAYFQLALDRYIERYFINIYIAIRG